MILERLERWMPHAVVPADNPLFKYEVRRIRWGQSSEQLIGYSLVVLLAVPFVMTSLWGFFLPVNSLAAPLYARDGYLLLLFTLGVGANLFLDMVSLAAALNGVGAEKGTGRWDTLRLTNLCAEQFVAAKQAAAQIRAWRMMALVMGLRISLITFLLIRIELLPTMLLFAGYLIVYVLEPFWRMRTLTAVGIAIATRMRAMTSSLMMSFMTMLTMWFAECAIIYIVFGWALRGDIIRLASVLVCLQPLLLIAASYTFYAFCRMTQRWAVRFANTHAFAQE